MEKLKVGQTLYEVVRNEIIEREIKVIGRKYFYIEQNCGNANFSIESLKYTCKDYSQYNRQLYISKQELEDKEEKRKLIFKIEKVFNSFNSASQLSLEQARAIDKIIFGGDDETKQH